MVDYRHISSETRPRREPIINVPPVLLWLLAAMWGAFGVLSLLPARLVFQFDTLIALSPQRLVEGAAGEGGYFGFIAPLFTHMFVHADLMHITVNSLWFLAFGSPVLRRLTQFGQERPGFLTNFQGPRPSAYASLLFLVFYLLCGVGASLFFVALNMQEPALLVGASGAVSGLLGGLVLFIGRRRHAFTRGYRPLAGLTDPIVVVGWLS